MRSKEKTYQRHAPVKAKPNPQPLPPVPFKKITPVGPVKPLLEWMQEKNAAYYQSSSTSIDSDFSTYAQSPNGMLTCANAMAFHSFARARPRQTYEILEVGVGSGMFALGFLQELARQDEAHQKHILSRVRYTLADFSEPILTSATQNILKELPSASVRAVRLDASNPKSIPAALGAFRFDVIWANELFDDLPAEAFCCKNEKIRAVHFDSKAQPQVVTTEANNLQLWEETLLRVLPPGYFIPLNRQAVAAVLELAQHLRPTGWMDVFDYGFYFKGDFGLFSSIWNEHLVRVYNKQWTVDVNFLYLAAALRQAGFNRITVERQKDYVQKTLGRPLSLNEKEGSLDYAPGEMPAGVPDMEEDDFFYHLQVRI